MATIKSETLIDAANAIIRARNFCAAHGHYDEKDFSPSEDQTFDDWASDILQTALATDEQARLERES